MVNLKYLSYSSTKINKQNYNLETKKSFQELHELFEWVYSFKHDLSVVQF